MVKEISLAKVMKALAKKLWLIVILAVIGGVGANLYSSNMIAPKYSSTSLLYIYNAGIGNVSGQLSQTNMVASQGALMLYLELYKTSTVLDAAENEIEEYKQGYLSGDEKYKDYGFLADRTITAGQIKGMITAYQANQTELLYIKSTADDPRVAQLVTSVVTGVLQNEIPKMLGATSNKVMQKATFSPDPTGPNVTQYTLLGVMAGIAFACVLVLGALVLDNVIRTEDDLLEVYPEIPVLGIIPDINSSRSDKRGYGYKNRN